MSELQRMVAAVAVATVWTKPESPRPMDELVLKRPVALRDWLNTMKVDDRLDLCDANRVQTQILYGASVLVEQKQDDWMKVLIPQQGTPKNELGYPGWVPSCQFVPETNALAACKKAEVVADTAWLYQSPSASEPLIELSCLTSLPVLEQEGTWVKVQSPDGTGYFKADEVRIIDGDAAPRCVQGHAGRGVVEQGKRFLDLPYLWGGMSAFGYDCSGFAYNMHKSMGILIPRDASAQAKQGTCIQKEQLEPGDLLFFAYEEGKGAVHHVGIYAGDERMIHAPESGQSVEIVDLRSYRLAKEHCISRRYWS